MRKILSISVLAIAFAAQGAFAQQKDDEHTAHHPEGQAQQGAAAPGGKGEDTLRQLGENMKKIQDLMAQIHATSDPAAKDELMNQHLKAMREQMKLVLAIKPGKMGMMGGKGMMGDDGSKDGAAGKKDGMMADSDTGTAMSDANKDAKAGGMGMMDKGGMMNMHKQMEGRMRMLEMMLEQMLEREAVETGAEHDH
jgi:hypothetical protein